MIAIIDYGVGNLFSLTASLNHLGAETIVTKNKEDIIAADRIILPGVGAFEDAIAKLRATGLVDTIIEETAKGKPLLGICRMHQCQHREHHPLVSGSQIIKELLGLLSLLLHVIWNYGREVVVHVLLALPVGDIGLNAEQPLLHLFHRLIGRYRNDID